MTHSKRYSKSILTSGIWEKSNNNIIKYHPTNHEILVYSNKMKKFDMWTLPWQALWQLPLHIITAQAVAVGCVWCSWWQFSTFQCRIASLWIIWLRGYRDMDRIDIGIEMWYRYWYRYRKICNDMQPYLNLCWLIFISEGLWHSPEENFTENAENIYLLDEFMSSKITNQ